MRPSPASLLASLLRLHLFLARRERVLVERHPLFVWCLAFGGVLLDAVMAVYEWQMACLPLCLLHLVLGAICLWCVRVVEAHAREF